MSLLDDLRNAGRALDIQFQPSTNEVQSVVGGIVHYLEHGDEFLKAVESGAEDVAKLLVPPVEEPATENASASPSTDPTVSAPPVTAELTDEELDKQISDLQAQRATRLATGQQTTVEHETGGGL